MNLHFLKSKEKKRLLAELEEQFGISKLPYLLLETGKQKIRGFSGTMTKEEIKELSTIANVEIVGAYLMKRERSLRLSLDATRILKSQIKKNIVEIDDEQLEDWLRGKNIDLKLSGSVQDSRENSNQSENRVGSDNKTQDSKGKGLKVEDDNFSGLRGVVVVKHGDDFIGCGISNGEKIINHVPKERRIRSS